MNINLRNYEIIKVIQLKKILLPKFILIKAEKSLFVIEIFPLAKIFHFTKGVLFQN